MLGVPVTVLPFFAIMVPALARMLLAMLIMVAGQRPSGTRQLDETSIYL